MRECTYFEKVSKFGEKALARGEGMFTMPAC
jgi:hypothetical protein